MSAVISEYIHYLYLKFKIQKYSHTFQAERAGASSGHSSIAGLPLLENEDVLVGGGILVKSEPDNRSDFTGEAEIMHIEDDEEDEVEEEM